MTSAITLRLDKHVPSIPNYITYAGFGLCGILAWVIQTNREAVGLMLLLNIGIGATDFFDGMMARYLKKKGYDSITELGKSLDPYRDKTYQIVMCWFFIIYPWFPWYLKITAFSSCCLEITLGWIRYVEIRRGVDTSAGRAGKWKMGLAWAVNLLSLLWIWGEKGSIANINPSWKVFLFLIFAVSIILAVQSARVHFAKLRN